MSRREYYLASWGYIRIVGDKGAANALPRVLAAPLSNHFLKNAFPFPLNLLRRLFT